MVLTLLGGKLSHSAVPWRESNSIDYYNEQTLTPRPYFLTNDLTDSLRPRRNSEDTTILPPTNEPPPSDLNNPGSGLDSSLPDDSGGDQSQLSPPVHRPSFVMRINNENLGNLLRMYADVNKITNNFATADPDIITESHKMIGGKLILPVLTAQKKFDQEQFCHSIGTSVLGISTEADLTYLTTLNQKVWVQVHRPFPSSPNYLLYDDGTPVPGLIGEKRITMSNGINLKCLSFDPSSLTIAVESCESELAIICEVPKKKLAEHLRRKIQKKVLLDEIENKAKWLKDYYIENLLENGFSETEECEDDIELFETPISSPSEADYETLVLQVQRFLSRFDLIQKFLFGLKMVADHTRTFEQIGVTINSLENSDLCITFDFNLNWPIVGNHSLFDFSLTDIALVFSTLLVATIAGCNMCRLWRVQTVRHRHPDQDGRPPSRRRGRSVSFNREVRHLRRTPSPGSSSSSSDSPAYGSAESVGPENYYRMQRI